MDLNSGNGLNPRNVRNVQEKMAQIARREVPKLRKRFGIAWFVGVFMILKVCPFRPAPLSYLRQQQLDLLTLLPPLCSGSSPQFRPSPRMSRLSLLHQSAQIPQ